VKASEQEIIVINRAKDLDTLVAHFAEDPSEIAEVRKMLSWFTAAIKPSRKSFILSHSMKVNHSTEFCCLDLQIRGDRLGKKSSYPIIPSITNPKSEVGSSSTTWLTHTHSVAMDSSSD